MTNQIGNGDNTPTIMLWRESNSKNRVAVQTFGYCRASGSVGGTIVTGDVNLIEGVEVYGRDAMLFSVID